MKGIYLCLMRIFPDLSNFTNFFVAVINYHDQMHHKEERGFFFILFKVFSHNTF